MVQEEGITRFQRAALRIASWTLLSRILGLVRDRLMVGLFGRGPVLGAFHLAWVLPNTFRRLLGEGALSASVVPVLTQRVDTDGVDGARRSFEALLGALLLLLIGIVGLGWGVIALLPESWLQGGEGGGEGYAALLRALLFVLFPYVVPVCLMSLAAAAQNVRGRFSLPAVAPALLNAVWIAGVFAVQDSDAPAERRITWIAAIVLGGGLLQLLLQLPGVLRSGMLGPPRIRLQDSDLVRTARNLLPVVAGLSVLQLNTVFTNVIAAWVVDRGAPTILFLANRLLEFPHAMLGVALGTAVFPLLSLLGGRGDGEAMRATLDRALATGVFLAIPAAVGLSVLAPQLVEVLFVTGRFTAADGRETIWVTRIMSLALPGLIGVQVLARAHYALGDMRTPVRIAVLLLVLAQALNLTLAPRFGTQGLAWSSAIGANLNALLLLWALRRRALPAGQGRVTRAALRSVIASAPMALVTWLSVGLLSSWFTPASGILLRIGFLLVLPAGIGVVVFLITAWLAGANEIREVLAARRQR